MSSSVAGGLCSQQKEPFGVSMMAGPGSAFVSRAPSAQLEAMLINPSLLVALAPFVTFAELALHAALVHLAQWTVWGI